MIALSIFLVAGLIIIAATWSDIRRVRAGLHTMRGTRAKRARKTDAAQAPADPLPQTLEGALVRQLMTNQVTAAQYRRAMGAVAVRDAERHPTQLPPDLNPPQMQ